MSADAAFALLHTPSAIRAWWSAARVVVVPQLHGPWLATWGANEDAPDHTTVARILVWDPPRRLRLGAFEYFTRDGSGLPFAANLETEFSIEAQGAGCRLRVEQTGFPAESIADAFLASCEQGWTATLDSLQRHVASQPKHR